jgi:hypothetical protein
MYFKRPDELCQHAMINGLQPRAKNNIISSNSNLESPEDIYSTRESPAVVQLAFLSTRQSSKSIQGLKIFIKAGFGCSTKIHVRSGPKCIIRGCTVISSKASQLLGVGQIQNIYRMDRPSTNHILCNQFYRTDR